MLEVSDTGLGMDRATQARIFDPFCTTKGQGKGTGLGWSTVFRVYFPRTAGYALAGATEMPHDPSHSGTETIVLVEDDTSVRNLVRRVLKSRGYEVLAAGDGGDALRVASDVDFLADLVLTDIMMPEMSGRERVEALHTGRRALRVLYMSGDTDDGIVRWGLNDPGMSVTQKPFTAENLAMQVRTALDAA